MDHHFLFTSQGEIWSDDHICKVFAEVCHEHGLPMGMQDFRQAFTALFRKFGRNEPTSHLVETSHHQAGHSLETAEVAYGTTNLDPLSVGPDTLSKFFEASQCWHVLLGLSTSPQVSKQKKVQVDATSGNVQPSAVNANTFNDQVHCSSSQFKSLCDMINQMQTTIDTFLPLQKVESRGQWILHSICGFYQHDLDSLSFRYSKLPHQSSIDS